MGILWEATVRPEPRLPRWPEETTDVKTRTFVERLSHARDISAESGQTVEDKARME